MTLIEALRNTQSLSKKEHERIAQWTTRDGNNFFEAVLCSIIVRTLPAENPYCARMFHPDKDAPTPAEPPIVSERLVRVLVSEYMKAKLNNELTSQRSVPALETFFDWEIAGCEIEACTLLLTPKYMDKDNSEEERACASLEYAGTNRKKTDNIELTDAQKANIPYSCLVVEGLRQKLNLNARRRRVFLCALSRAGRRRGLSKPEPERQGLFLCCHSH